MNNKKLSQHDESAIIAMANRNYANNGRANSDRIAIACGITPQHVMFVLRRADNRGLLVRHCSAAPHGVRCGAPIPDRERGNLRITNCDAHRQPARSEYASPRLVRSAAPMPVAKAAPAVAPPMPERLATALDGLTVEMVEGEPRASAFQLAELLGFERTRKIKDLIDRNKDELEVLGQIYRRPTVGRQSTGNGASREYTVKVPWLNRTQCHIVAMKAATPNAAEARVKIAKSFEREQDRAAAAISGPPSGDDRIARLIDVVAQGQQQMMQVLGGLAAALVARGAPAVPFIAEKPSAFDVEASAADKGDFLSVSDIAGVNQLPGGPALKRKNWALVTLWLKTSGIFRNPKHCRVHKIKMLLGGKTKEEDSWVYDPAIVSAPLVLRDVADYLFQALRDGSDVSDAYTHARSFIKNSAVASNQ